MILISFEINCRDPIDCLLGEYETNKLFSDAKPCGEHKVKKGCDCLYPLWDKILVKTNENPECDLKKAMLTLIHLENVCNSYNVIISSLVKLFFYVLFNFYVLNIVLHKT